MRAGIVAVKLPMEDIIAPRTEDDVTWLAESIRRFGLLQPVGVRRTGEKYRLVFGVRRYKACELLGRRYIHCVLLSVREEEEALFRLQENHHRRPMKLCEDAAVLLSASDADALCLSPEDALAAAAFLAMSEEQQNGLTDETRLLLQKAKGDLKTYERLLARWKDLERPREALRLSVMSDRRIFLNEIGRILRLMQRGGYADSFTEDEKTIVIRKVI